MTKSKRENRIPAHVPILESFVCMLNAREDSLERSIEGSDFQVALRDRFDKWIKRGQLDPSPNDGCPLDGSTLRHHLDENGVAQFSLNFFGLGGAKGPLEPGDHAEMWFRLFLCQKGRGLLSRCSKCDRYFLRKRLRKLGGDLMRGEFCPEHRSQIRIQSTRSSRNRERERRLSLVVEFLKEYDAKKPRDQWKTWVKDKFNDRPHHPIEKPMTVAWLTRHEEEIKTRRANTRPYAMAKQVIIPLDG